MLIEPFTTEVVAVPLYILNVPVAVPSDRHRDQPYGDDVPFSWVVKYNNLSVL